MVGFRVFLQRVADGEVRVHPVSRRWEDIDEYRWTEGNDSCDCNRHYYFHGDTPLWDEAPCGESLYRVLKIEDDDGKVILEGPA